MEPTTKCKKCGVKIITIRGRTFDEALTLFRRKIAFEHIDKFRKKVKLKMTTEEIIAAKNYGRK